MYLFAIDHKNVIIYIKVMLKTVSIKNNDVCYVKYITLYTKLVSH